MTQATPISVCEESAPLLSPVPRRTLSDHVLDTLRKAIISGAYVAGDHLAESALGQQLGVSRAPVREALMQLEREGLLSFDRRGAALVKAFTNEDLEEIYSLRLALETMAARLASQRMNGPTAGQLVENIRRTANAAGLLEVTLLDVEFHDLIVQASGHSRLYAGWTNLRHQIEVWLARMQSRLETATHNAREETVNHHQVLFEALRSGLAERAEAAMRAHIEGWRQRWPSSRVEEAK